MAAPPDAGERATTRPHRLRDGDDRTKAVLSRVWRANDDTAGDAVQSDHRKGRRELLMGGDENRAPAERTELAAKA
jgi:hypothetical protein